MTPTALSRRLPRTTAVREHDTAHAAQAEFPGTVAGLRRQHPTFRRRRFFDGRPVARGEGEPLPDIVWMTPSGEVMTQQDWDAGVGRSVAVYLNGNGIRGTDERGQHVVDDSFLLLFNAHDNDLDFALPPDEYGPAWQVVIDTSGISGDGAPRPAGGSVPVTARGTVVLVGATGELPVEPEVAPAAAVPDVSAPPPGSASVGGTGAGR